MTDQRPSTPVTGSGIPIDAVYSASENAADQSLPGAYPFTRGIYSEMYRNRLWTMRQYAGYASAAETNERFKLLLAGGGTGLSVAFDLPTQIGYDSDHPLSDGEVGRVGVAVDTLEDMERLFAGIPLDKVSTSMTINATAAMLLLLYELAADKQGVPATALRGTVQNDILKEYVARGTYIFPPRPSMRLITDIFAYCSDRIPQWNTISISGYHIREAGATAVQELAFTLANGIAYIESALKAGLKIEQFAPRLSFFFNAHIDFFEEIAKFRAARRLWATIIRDRFNCDHKSSQLMRFHTQTAGSALTAQQPLNNVVRVTLQALAGVLGGTQSLHTNGYDEALALPTADSATLALRTQQIIGMETGITASADPLGGSYYVEHLTDEIERRARELIEEIDSRGGAVAAIESGFMQSKIELSAYDDQLAVQSGDKIVVGMNYQRTDQHATLPLHHLDPEGQRDQIQSLAAVKSSRSGTSVTETLSEIRSASRGTDNLLPPMRRALAAYATIGEICTVLREEWGEYQGS
jgi:methylmalonyl-CoA mutase N-terminal domain/subunit